MMLEANEINPNVSEDKLTMDASDEDEDSMVNKTAEGEKILKGLTMEVSLGLALISIGSTTELSPNSH